MEDESSLDPQKGSSAAQKRKLIIDLLGSDVKLRSKRELIERFIDDYMPKMSDEKNVAETFSEFWSEEKSKALKEICASEGLKIDSLQDMIEDYHFTGKEPLSETIVSALNAKPKILERKSIVKRVTEKLMSFVRVFDDDMGDV